MKPNFTVKQALQIAKAIGRDKDLTPNEKESIVDKVGRLTE